MSPEIGHGIARKRPRPISAIPCSGSALLLLVAIRSCSRAQLEKSGIIEKWTGNERTVLGQKLEPEVLKVYQKATNGIVAAHTFRVRHTPLRRAAVQPWGYAAAVGRWQGCCVAMLKLQGTC